MTRAQREMGSYLADVFLVITTQILFFASGWLFFVRKISGEYKVKNVLVLSIFAATFSLSCTLFELIIFEILDILNRTCAPLSGRVLSP